MPQLPDTDRTKAPLEGWRQGDFVVGDVPFLYLGLDEAARPAAVEAPLRGYLVLTQTCDIVQARSDFIEVCPLVTVEPTVLREIELARRPSYAYVPALREQGLVGDLSRTMTVQREVAMTWSRTPGQLDAVAAEALARALARKRQRPAFPDEFVEWIRPLMSRFDGKHDKKSDEGRALQAMLEVRVHADPSWNAQHARITIYLIRKDGEPPPSDELKQSWLDRLKQNGQFEPLPMWPTLEEMTAAEYCASLPLDLDYLTPARDRKH